MIFIVAIEVFIIMRQCGLMPKPLPDNMAVSIDRRVDPYFISKKQKQIKPRSFICTSPKKQTEIDVRFGVTFTSLLCVFRRFR